MNPRAVRCMHQWMLAPTNHACNNECAPNDESVHILFCIFLCYTLCAFHLWIRGQPVQWQMTTQEKLLNYENCRAWKASFMDITSTNTSGLPRLGKSGSVFLPMRGMHMTCVQCQFKRWRSSESNTPLKCPTDICTACILAFVYCMWLKKGVSLSVKLYI